MTTRTVTAGHRGTATCAHCGASFPITRRGRKYCGGEDCARDLKRKQQRTYDRRGVGATCIVCGSAFTASTTRVKVCSPACHGRSRATARYAPRSCFLCRNKHRHGTCPHCAKARAQAYKDFIEIRRRLRAHRERWKTETRQCKDCGADFSPRQPHARYCAQACKKRAAQRQSRRSRRGQIAASRTGRINRAEILHRDQWTCQLCGEPLERDATVPHPHAPTLDHIVPLALGGAHGPENLQAAHFICNSRKSDTRTWDQRGQPAAVSP